jgi:hypothetical protein
MFVTHDRDDRDIICFIGDSYAMAGSGVINPWPFDNKSWPSWAQQADPAPCRVYTDLVADRLNMRPLVLGFGGASWWQTRSVVLDFFKRNPEEKKYIKKIVATHTDFARINSTRCDRATDERLRENNAFDIEFNRWSQLQWFRELSNDIFPGIPMINFSCFGWEALAYEDNLGYETVQGMIFLGSLLKITLGEVTGNKKTTIDYLRNSHAEAHTHYCHLNEKNHKTMADLIYETFVNYQSGSVLDLPYDRFDQSNPNARHWPDGRYWTD